MKFENAIASGLLDSLVSAIGQMIGGCVFSGEGADDFHGRVGGCSRVEGCIGLVDGPERGLAASNEK